MEVIEMGERYWVTGVQLGLMKFAKQRDKEIKKIIDKGAVSFCSGKESRIADAYIQQGGDAMVLADRADYKNLNIADLMNVILKEN